MIERGTEARGSSGAGNDRTKAVDAAILAIEKQFGRGSIMRLGSSERQAVDIIPTGSIALDLALGVGGIPRGRNDRDLRPRVVGQDHALPAHPREAQRAAALSPSSTSNTLWTRATRVLAA